MGDKGDGKGGGKGGDYSQYMDYSKYMSQGGGKDDKKDTTIALVSTDSSQGGGKSGGSPGGDYSQYMDYSKYMSQGGGKDDKKDKGDGKGGGKGGDYSQYMDYSKYMSQGGGNDDEENSGVEKQVTKHKSNSDDTVKDAPPQKAASEIALASQMQTWRASRYLSAGLVTLLAAVRFSRQVPKVNNEELEP